jgi:hypothetical protein
MLIYVLVLLFYCSKSFILAQGLSQVLSLRGKMKTLILILMQTNDKLSQNNRDSDSEEYITEQMVPVLLMLRIST